MKILLPSLTVFSSCLVLLCSCGSTHGTMDTSQQITFPTYRIDISSTSKHYSCKVKPKTEELYRYQDLQKDYTQQSKHPSRNSTAAISHDVFLRNSSSHLRDTTYLVVLQKLATFVAAIWIYSRLAKKKCKIRTTLLMLIVLCVSITPAQAEDYNYDYAEEVTDGPTTITITTEFTTEESTTPDGTTTAEPTTVISTTTESTTAEDPTTEGPTTTESTTAEPTTVISTTTESTTAEDPTTEAPTTTESTTAEPSTVILTTTDSTTVVFPTTRLTTTEILTTVDPCLPPYPCPYENGWRFTSDLGVLAGLNYTDELGTPGTCIYNQTNAEFVASFSTIWASAEFYLGPYFRCSVVSSFSKPSDNTVIVEHSIIVSRSTDFEPSTIKLAFVHGLNVTKELDQYTLDEETFDFFKEYDECLAGDDNCTQICTDTRKGFTCSCREGFFLDDDYSTCLVIDPCNGLLCTNGKCVLDENRLPFCQCDNGYQLPPDSNDLCIDVNECNSGTHMCNQICENTIGSYLCFCRTGYELGSDQRTCSDIDECQDMKDDCDQICENTESSYECSCNPGYTLNPANGWECIENNECNSFPCLFGNCTDRLNDYDCACYPGYVGDNCGINIDECASDPCVYGDCQDRVDDYMCYCYPGWQGKNCDQDVNECALNQDKCQHICNNVDRTVDPRGYQCSCNPGYDLHPDGRQCIEINECESSPCMNGARCLDEVNRYRCDCQGTGFQGTNCQTDIDECSSDPPCDLNADCTNSHGSYECTCKEGFRGDGDDTCYKIILFPYGVENGDQSLRENYDKRATKQKNDRISETIRPPSGFPFGGAGDFYYSLYFTDNGNVVFIKEQEDKYAYPTPPQRGFPTNPPTPMIAAFWQDGDTSYKHQSVDKGDVFYQVYDRPYHPDEAHIFGEANDRLRSFSDNPIGNDFTATWILIITWFELPAIPAKNRYQDPNTFQLVLVTDGIYSFGLINFKEDAMLWDYRLLKNTDVIYGYSSADGRIVENGQNRFSTDEQKYRPDQYNGNIGKKGQWIYRLERNRADTVNYKKRCLDWVQATAPPPDRCYRWYYYWICPWDWDLGQCPCSYWQAIWDFRYTWASRPSLSFLYQYAWWTGRDINELDEDMLNNVYRSPYNYRCMQRRWSNGYGAGQHCCYRGDGSLVRNFDGVWSQSYVHREHARYFGWWWFSWTEEKRLLFNDIYPRYYCCERSNDQSFCQLYEERRPQGNCNGYRPPGWGWWWGDPHITTLDGLGYTFNGLGEYVLLDVNNGTTVIQGRTKQVIDQNTGKAQDATAFESFALQETNSSRIQYTLWDEGGDFDLYIDEVLVNKTLLSEGYYVEDLVNVDIEEIEDENGNNRTVTAFVSGVAVSVAAIDQLLDISISAPEDFKNNTKGLMGVWNDDPSDDTTFPNGTVKVPSDGNTMTDKEYFDFGETWKVQADMSLFFYDDGQTWETVNVHPEYVPLFLDDLIKQYENDPFLDQANTTCDGDLECLFDSLATYDESVGLASKKSSETFEEQEEQLVNFPPNITADGVVNGTLVLNVRVNVPIEPVQLDADDENGDLVKFNLTEDVLGATVDEIDGLFEWTPLNLDVVRIGLAASDDKGATSVLIVEVHNCECQNDGTCDYSSDQSSSVEDNYYVAACICNPAFSGDFCEVDNNECGDTPCFADVLCTDVPAPGVGFDCGPCPEGMTGNGTKCYDYDECIEGQEQDGGVICNHNCENTYLSYVCTCFTDGYRLQANGKTCIDIDECMENKYDCQDNAICNNTQGSYVCNCEGGYRDVTRGNETICEDINECLETEPCNINADCENIDGSFVCRCDEGYEGNGVDCTDIDECSRNIDNCDKHADCINTNGSFTCRCQAGWDGNGTSCQDVNECQVLVLSHNCHPQAECTNSDGGFFCTCREGYSGNGTSCTDINECLNNPCDPDTQACFNIPGEYYCSCASGFEPDSNGTSCVDTDECDSANNCDKNAVCNNNVGSYTCACRSGFDGDGVQCIDIDECSLLSPCNTTSSYCDNVPGSYQCKCKAGYRNESGECVNIDECFDGTDGCEEPADCIDEKPGFSCLCPDGYNLSPNGRQCDDIDECASRIDDCDQICNNTIGGFWCDCFDGYYYNETEGLCSLLDSCSLDCGDNGFCVPQDGGPICECDRGYYKYNETEDTCLDIDECADPAPPCSQTCTNTDGGYNCTCRIGYELGPDFITCIDIDECRNTATCDDNAQCINELGSFRCTCNSGFDGDGFTCTDINECDDGSHTCSDKATCVNEEGGYGCVCIPGYIWTGSDCLDIDECQSDQHNCSDVAQCTNTDGSYNCTCNDGYCGDGFTCTDTDECTMGTDACDLNASCNNTHGGYDCACREGYDGNGFLCADIDECKDTAICDENAQCINKPGSFECSCNIGYNGDGFNCADVDECSSFPCAYNAYCNNTDGSYLCTCAPGYRGDGYVNGSCTDINECDEGSDVCDENAQCQDTDGGYICDCNVGWEGNGFICTDKDECVSDEDNNCHHPWAFCQDTEGSYYCECKQGYEGDGVVCNDINECQQQNACVDPALGGICTNGNGTYTCSCESGFIGNGTYCNDVNECVEENFTCAGANEICVNSFGNVFCQCDYQYYRNETNDICQVGETFNVSVVFTDINYRGYRQYFQVPADGEVANYDAYDTLEITDATNALQSDLPYLFSEDLFIKDAKTAPYFTTLRITHYRIDWSMNNTDDGVISFFYVNFIKDSPISTLDVRTAFLGGLEGGNRANGSVVLPHTLIVQGDDLVTTDSPTTFIITSAMTTPELTTSLPTITSTSVETATGSTATPTTTEIGTDVATPEEVLTTNPSKTTPEYGTAETTPEEVLTTNPFATTPEIGTAETTPEELLTTNPFATTPEIGTAETTPEEVLTTNPSATTPEIGTAETTPKKASPTVPPITGSPTLSPMPPECSVETESEDCDVVTQKCAEGVCVCRQGYTECDTDGECCSTDVFKVELTIYRVNNTDVEWDSDLADSSSALFKEYELLICLDMKQIFSGMELEDSPYRGCEVIAFRRPSTITDYPLLMDTSGIIADYQLLMDPEAELDVGDVNKTIHDAIDGGEFENVTPVDDGVKVGDLDECTEDLHECDKNALCTNAENGYVCECEEGFKDEFPDKKQGYYCVIPEPQDPDNTIAIVVGSIAAALLVAFVVMLAVLLYYRKRYTNYKSQDTRSSAGRTSRSSSISGPDVFPVHGQQNRPILDLRQEDDLFGASHDDISVGTLDSDDESLTESERYRIKHIARVMKKMPKISAINVSEGDSGASIFPRPQLNRRTGSDGDSGKFEPAARPRSWAPDPHPQLRNGSQHIDQSQGPRRFGRDSSPLTRVTSMPPMREEHAGVDLDFGNPFSGDPSFQPNRQQYQPRDQPIRPQRPSRFGRDAHPPNRPDMIRVLPPTSEVEPPTRRVEQNYSDEYF